jgi:drug/metabolite transporter (DMT)-like permease
MVQAYREQHTPTISKQWLGLIGIAGFFAFNLGANNMSLLSISLSLNQVIRACIPVATALGSVFFESKTPTRQELISLVVLVSGVGISVWEGNSKATVNGITLCILGKQGRSLRGEGAGYLTPSAAAAAAAACSTQFASAHCCPVR